MAEQKIKIIIADDHALYRDGLKLLLDKEPDFEICASAAHGRQLVEQSLELRPDVAIVDLQMPEMGGIEAIREIVSKSRTKCIAHSSYENHYNILEAINAGAIGYVGKNARRGEIAMGVRTIAGGEPFYCQAAASALAKAVSRNRFRSASGHPCFSDKEIKILLLIAQDKSNKEISEEMFLSPRTVEGIRSNLLSKMKVKTATGMIMYALKHHLFTLDDVD